MKRHYFSFALIASLVVALTASAQEVGVEGGSSSGYQPAIAYPSSSFSWLDHSSTAEEGILRGAGAYAEGVGKANYLGSLAAMNYQEAYRRALENSVHELEAYYERKDLWYDHQEKYRRKSLGEEGYRKLAASRTPDRLTAEQYDAQSGAIRWPYPLDGEAFAESRKLVERRMSERSVENAGWGSRNHELLRREVEAMRAILDSQRQALQANQYVIADSFLDSVLWEGRFVPDDTQLTAVQ